MTAPALYEQRSPSVCRGCNLAGESRYVATTPGSTGWWKYPEGWFVGRDDDGPMLACSLACVAKAEAYEKRRKNPWARI